jgi:putative ABC transport system substrate-binding protein
MAIDDGGTRGNRGGGTQASVCAPRIGRRPVSAGSLSRRVLLLASGACLTPGLAGAQPAGRPYRIALLPDFGTTWEPLLKLFVQVLQGFGRVEGRDYVFVRSGLAYGQETERAVRLAVEAQPDLIYVANLGYAIAAHKLTKTIPIVMWVSGFPVEGGVADSLARPGKNVTGLTIYAGAQVFGKLVQLLVEARPGLKRIGAFCTYLPPFHPAEEAGPIIAEIREGGRRLGVDVRIFEIARAEQVADALAGAASERVEALLLTSGVSLTGRRAEVMQFAVERRLPTISDAEWTVPMAHSPLLSYGADFVELIRQSAPYVDRILWQGRRPAELPIQLPARFELIANVKTAKAIGLQLPQAVLLRADRVIE